MNFDGEQASSAKQADSETWRELRLLTDELMDPLSVLIAGVQYAVRESGRSPLPSTEATRALEDAAARIELVCELARAVRRRVLENDPGPDA